MPEGATATRRAPAPVRGAARERARGTPGGAAQRCFGCVEPAKPRRRTVAAANPSVQAAATGVAVGDAIDGPPWDRHLPAADGSLTHRPRRRRPRCPAPVRMGGQLVFSSCMAQGTWNAPCTRSPGANHLEHNARDKF